VETFQQIVWKGIEEKIDASNVRKAMFPGKKYAFILKWWWLG